MFERPAEKPCAKAVFIAARVIENVGQRHEYLNHACGSDVALRQKVENLLAAASKETGSSPLDAMEAAFGPEQTGIPLSGAKATDAPHEHRQIGRYKLLEQIGQGGFGSVYMAEQTSPVRREVALKILKPGMDTKEVIARFEVERQALAMMDHPNIARVLDGGATAEGRPYFVMELVRGIPLTEYCDEARLTTEERLELFVDVCRAVQHAHQKGIIHRDLKPTNVLVTMHDDKAVAKVFDFGIAKALGQTLTDRTLLTGYQQLLGTPLYMSPEQAQMSGIDIDTRSDVYSLGVMLYELLTGTTPFTKESLSNAGFDELRRIIREQEPPRPSDRLSTLDAAARSTLADRRRVDQRCIRDELRGELDWIVMQALEKDRNRRYESASALAADVQRYLKDEPVLACPPSPGYRLKKYLRRHRAGVTWGLAGVAALLVCGTLIAYPRFREADRVEKVRRQVELALREAETAIEAGDLALAEKPIANGMALVSQDRTALADVTARIDKLSTELKQRQSDQARYDELLTNARDAQDRMTYGGHLKGDSAAEFTLSTSFGVLDRDDWLRRLDSSYLSPEQIARAKETIYETLLCLADHGPRWVKTEESARQSFELLERAEQFHAPTKALHWVRSECHKLLKETDARERALVQYDAAPALTALDYYLPGHTAGWRGNREAAIKAYRAALRIQPDHYNSLLFLANRLVADKHFDEGIAYYTGCIALRPNHVNTILSRAEAYQESGDNATAELDYLAATKVSAPASDIVHAYRTLLYYYRRNYQHDKHAAALEHLKADVDRFLTEQATNSGLDDLSELEVLSVSGSALCEAGAMDDGIPLLKQALAGRRKMFGGVHEKTLLSLNNLGSMLCVKQAAQAVPLLEEALAVSKELYGQDDVSTLTVMSNLGDAYARAGRPLDGIPLLQDAVAGLERKQDVDQTSTAMRRLGSAFIKAQQWDKAVPVLEATLARHIESLGPDHFKTLEVMNNLGFTYGNVGQSEKAISLLEDAFEKHSRLFGGESAMTLRVTGNLSSAYLSAGQAQKVIALLEPSLSIHRKIRGPEHPDTLKVLNNLGAALTKLGRPQEAVPILTTNLDLHRRTFGSEHSKTLVAMNNLGMACVRAERLDEGVALLEQVLEIQTQLRGPDHPESLAASLTASVELLEVYRPAGKRDEVKRVALSRIEILRTQSNEIQFSSFLASTVDALLTFGEFAEAEPLARECLQIREARLPESWLRFNTQSLLGGALVGQEKYAEAEPLLLQAMVGLEKHDQEIPLSSRRHVVATIERLVTLYEATDHPEDAARWKAKLPTNSVEQAMPE